jgi:hypothetical protein
VRRVLDYREPLVLALHLDSRSVGWLSFAYAHKSSIHSEPITRLANVAGDWVFLAGTWTMIQLAVLVFFRVYEFWHFGGFNPIWIQTVVFACKMQNPV